MDQLNQTNSHTHANARTAPGPRAWPLIGDTTLLRGARNPLHVLETHRYGDVFRVRVFGQSTLIVSHP